MYDILRRQSSEGHQELSGDTLDDVQVKAAK